MPPAISPTHRPFRAYTERIEPHRSGDGAYHERALRAAFRDLLEETRPKGWTITPEETIAVAGRTVRAHAVFRDGLGARRGVWEAKDGAGGLEAFVEKRRRAGCPLDNALFDDTRTAILYRDGRESCRADLADPAAIATLLPAFHDYDAHGAARLERATDALDAALPDLATGLVVFLRDARAREPKVAVEFERLAGFRRRAIDPAADAAAVESMVVAHLVGWPLARAVFADPGFARRNVVAAELERLARALAHAGFRRRDVMRPVATVANAAAACARASGTAAERRRLLGSLIARVSRGCAVAASIPPVELTPQPIVEFVAASVAEAVLTEFRCRLGAPEARVLDPCAGTGAFLAALLRHAPADRLDGFYRERLFANERELLPYYAAALAVEHTWRELTDRHESFRGLCWADSFALSSDGQLRFPFLVDRNIERAERQVAAPINVVIAAPPFGIDDSACAGEIEARVRETYGRDSAMTSRTALAQAYVRVLRWATDRLGGRDGIICLVGKNGFIDEVPYDGLRAHVAATFTSVYHVDLHGGRRDDPDWSAATHNVLGLDEGVGVTLLIRNRHHQHGHRVLYHRVPDAWRAEDKFAWLARKGTMGNVPWEPLLPDDRGTWIPSEHAGEFASFVPIVARGPRSRRQRTGWAVVESIFAASTLGVNTARDRVAYDFDRETLAGRIRETIDRYNGAVERYRATGVAEEVDGIKWSRGLRMNLRRGRPAVFDEGKIRAAHYRPFCRMHLFLDRVLNEETYAFSRVLPTPDAERENALICASGPGEESFRALMTRSVVDLKFLNARNGGTRAFPRYTYDERPGGIERCDNVTPWAIAHFREHYGDPAIDADDIFAYVYAVLHHPRWRERFRENLARELPRIPLAGEFRAFAAVGRELAALHLNYDEVEPFPLERDWTPDVAPSYCVEAMRIAKDGASVIVNGSLALRGIPPIASRYVLGNRTALGWVVDQHAVRRDADGTILADPNRTDAPEQVVDLVGRIVAVSVRTMELVDFLAGMEYDGEE